MKERNPHKKHSNLSKPNGGRYHFNEWSIIGAPCDIIDQLAEDLRAELESKLKLGYLNASHAKRIKKEKFNNQLLDNSSYRNIKIDQDNEHIPYRQIFNGIDLLFINGNHFLGSQQIVIINEKKKESLSRKLDRLTDIKIILLEKSSDDIYDFVLEKIEQQSEVKVFRISEVSKISKAILDIHHSQLPPLWGLVLAGGRSQRMGEDKGELSYHGEPQREYEAKLLKSYCGRTFISCRQNQDELIETEYEKLYDTFSGLGPFGGIVSAFRFNPNTAWLTLACDLPYLDNNTLKQLVKARNPNKLATCFYNPETNFPEPLITIWEPRAYPVLLNYLSLGYSCPRKVLINSDIEIIDMETPIKMKNANTPDERLSAINYFKAEQNAK